MGYKRLTKDHRGRKKGDVFKTKQKHITVTSRGHTTKYTHDELTDDSYLAALAARRLEHKFEKAKTRENKRKIKQLTVSLANLSKAKAMRIGDTSKKNELLDASDEFKDAHKKMIIPPKPSKTPKKPVKNDLKILKTKALKIVDERSKEAFSGHSETGWSRIRKGIKVSRNRESLKNKLEKIDIDIDILEGEDY